MIGYGGCRLHKHLLSISIHYGIVNQAKRTLINA